MMAGSGGGFGGGAVGSSRGNAREGFRYMDGIDMQDSYDVDDDDVGSNEAFDNYYDAQGGGDAGQSSSAADSKQVIPEVRVNLDPSDRLIEAMETLREVIVENSNIAKGGGRRRGRGGQAQGSAQPYRANGTPMGMKDDRLKIRREKVGLHFLVIYL